MYIANVFSSIHLVAYLTIFIPFYENVAFSHITFMLNHRQLQILPLLGPSEEISVGSQNTLKMETSGNIQTQ